MHWWGRGRYASGGTRLLGNYYSKHYGETLAKSARNKSRIMCDGSPDTIWNPGITMEAQLRASRSYFHLVPAPTVLPASLIKEFTPKAKFVIIMRNPTERLFSHYRYRGPSTNVDSHLNRTLENFDAGVKQMKPILDFCFEKKSIRDCAYDPAFLLDGERTRVLLQVGLYVVYIKDWLTVFPRNQFYFTTTEEYGANPNRVMKEIFQFLALDMGQNPEKMLNDVIATYWPGHNSVDLGPMWPRTKRKLDAFYEPFNEALAALLNDVKYLWRSDTDNL
ncbi:carbohydrate sulfotransferase 15-like [Lineus longissimus]|uniref:carbohydrate sulfotransferase 15-like n=1 Tax=Lineus longissimus TaxID=88925 RepID=UPI00315DA408